MWGFPINVTFVSLDQLWKDVMTTKIHMVDRNDVEFVLTVYVKPYPANIYSVWIYLAAIFDKNSEYL